MANFKLEDIPTKDMQALGLHDGNNLLLDEKTKSALLNGQLTDFVRIKELDFGGTGKVSIDAKLSLRHKTTGDVALLIHPIYKKRANHPNLTASEAEQYAKSGTHIKPRSAYGTLKSFGAAPYQFDDKNKMSYFIELEKSNGKSTTIWSVDLERALEKSKHQIGDKVQLYHHGTEKVKVDVPIYSRDNEVIGSETKEVERNNWEVADYQEAKKEEKYMVYEFDQETNSFVSVDTDNIIAPEEINGIKLTPEQKREFKEGKAVSLSDGTEIQASPASKNGIRSNKRFLIASLLLDGGISFLIYHAVNAIMKRGQAQKQKENEYSKGYLDALKKVQIDLERKQAKYPNDKSFTDDLNTLKKEAARFTASKGVSESVENEPDINETKARVNDPDMPRNAEEREEENALQRDEHNERAQEENEERNQGRRR